MEVLGLIDVPVWLLTTVALLLFSIWYNFSMYTHFPKHGIDGPRPWPFLGNMVASIRTGFLEYEVVMYQRYKHKRCYGSFFLGMPSLIITDVNVMKDVLVKQFNKFANRRVFLRNTSPMNKMMTVLVDDHWKHVRSMSTPTFTTGRLKNMTGLIKTACNQLATNLDEKCQKNEEVDLKDVCGCFTMDVIASTMFGIQVDSQKDPNGDFVKNAKEIFNFSVTSPRFLLLIMFPKLANFLSKFGIQLFDLGALKFFADVTDHAMKLRKENPGKYHDFLDIMLKDEVPDDQVDSETKQPTGDVFKWSSKGILREEILATAVIFFLAGYETTGSTLHFVFYRLAMDQDVQDKVMEEIREVVGDDDVTYEHASKLEYLDMCIQEVLRLYPPAFRFDRIAAEDVVIDGITITKGTSVAFPAYAIHMDPEIYPDPKKFDPLRFTEEAKAARSIYHWMPFGMGPRNCIGMRLALLEMKMLAATLLSKFRFTPAPSTPDPENLVFKTATMRPIKPIKLRVELRE